jgi:RHS repeat-associated protein
VTVTDASGERDLVISYPDSGEEGEISGVYGSNGQSATFSYCSSSSPGYESTCLTGDLIAATDPNSATTSYTYDSTNDTSSLKHDLLATTDPAGDVVTNTYDGYGRVTTQTDPDGGETQLSYTEMNESTETGTVAVTDPDGVVTDYSYINGVLIASDVDPGTSGHDESMRVPEPTTLQPAFEIDGDGHVSGMSYDADGNTVLSTDAEGNTTQYAYNDLDEQWCEVEPAEYADGVRCPGTEPSTPPTYDETDPDLGMTISYYDDAGHLVAESDPLGNTTAYAYTDDVEGVPDGLQYCSVDPVDYHADVSCPAYGASHVDGTTTETFNSAGEVTSQTNALGKTTDYSYNDDDELSTETVPDGTETSYSYDAAGEVTEETVTFGDYSASTLSAYDADGRRYCEVAPAEVAADVTCPDSPPESPPTPGDDDYLGATITTYDGDGQATQVTNPLGGITYTAYDSAGRVYCTVSAREAAADVTCPGSPPESPPTPGDDYYLGATITTYNALGEVAQVTNPLGGITLSTYDQAGNLTESEVETGDAGAPDVVTTYLYDDDDRVDGTTVGSGDGAATTKQEYDPDGDVYCSVSADAVSGDEYHCPAWQADWIDSPPGPTSLYSSDPDSAQAEDVSTAFYDADGNELQSSDALGDTTVTAYDGDGRAYCSADPSNVAAYLTDNPDASYPYLCPSSAPSSAPDTATGYVTSIYDADGNTLSTTDQEGDTTSYTYGDDGVLTTTNQRDEVTTDCYYYEDGDDQCAADAPSGGGNGGDLYSTTTPDTSADPDGETTKYSYFAGGAADEATTPAGTTTDGYDAMGDLTSLDYSGTASGYATPADVSYTYDVDGSRASMSDGTGTTDYGYDAAGDLTEQSFSPASNSGLAATTLDYAYYPNGALDTVTYPAYGDESDPVATYTYDDHGEMASLSDWLSEKVAFSDDGDANLTGVDDEVSDTTKVDTTLDYDAADDPTEAQTSEACGDGSGTLTQDFSPDASPLNADGQVTEDEETDAGDCSGTSYERNYSYDLDGRVVYQGSVAQGESAANFSYDAASDPSEISSHDSSDNFDTYDQDFDDAGEVTSQTPVEGSDGSSSTFTYDTLGDQLTDDSTSDTTSTYDQAGQLTAESSGSVSGSTDAYDGDGQLTTESGWSPVTDVDGDNTIFSISCPTTSFCAAVDNDGNLFSWNGSSWSSADDIDTTVVMYSVSCTSSSDCTAADNSGDVLYTTNGWSSHTRTNVDSHMIDRVSCASSSDCTAVDNDGRVVSTANDWSTHSGPTEIDGTTHIGSVSCPTTSFCAAVDNDGEAATESSGTWSSFASIDGTNEIESVDCTSATFCVATDVDGNAMVYDGSSWSAPQAVDPTTLRGPSCASDTFCVAVDHEGGVLAYDGAPAAQLTWSPAVASLPSVVSDGTWDYLYGPAGEPVEQVNISSSPPADNPQFLLYEPSDDAWLVNSTAGTQLAIYRYDAFGNLALGTPGSAFGYGGQYEGLADNANGLEDMRARWYQAQTGEFTSVDPDLAATDQAYAYAGGDPVNEGDPSGNVAITNGGEGQGPGDSPTAALLAFLESFVSGALSTEEGRIGIDQYVTAGSDQGLSASDQAFLADQQECEFSLAACWGSVDIALGASPSAADDFECQLLAENNAFGDNGAVFSDPVGNLLLGTIASVGAGGLAQIGVEAVLDAVASDAADAAAGGGISVYTSVNAAGDVNYVGITNDIARRAAEQFAGKGITIRAILGLTDLSRSDARAVEQVLIEEYGGPSGGQLLNKINSIAKTNPIYAQSIQRGCAILAGIGYPAPNVC